MGIDVRDPDQMVGTLSGGERQAVAIARAVYFGAKMLILDEPTSALGVKQSGVVLRYIVQARDRGLGVIFITHNPHHAWPVGDRFVVLNRGRMIGRLGQGRHQPRRAGEDDGRRRRARAAHARAGARAGDRMTHDQPAAEVGRRRAAHPDRRRPDRLRLARPGPQPLAAADPDAVRGPAVRHRARDLRRQRAGARRARRSAAFGYAEAAADWRRVVERPGRRRGLHHGAEHAPRRADRGGRGGRQGHLLREAGRRHAGADRARGRGARATSSRGVGYNYRWAPLVQYARQLIADGRLGEITNYRGRFFSMYGSDPLEPAVVALPARRGRPRRDDRPAQPLGRPRAHAARPDRARRRDDRDVHPRAAAAPPAGTHYGRGSAGRPARRR